MSDYRGVTSLVTGGAGYLGSHVVKQLLENDYKVRVLDDLSFGQHSVFLRYQDSEGIWSAPRGYSFTVSNPETETS